MTATPDAIVTIRKILPCAPDIAFRAWTTPALFKEWFFPKEGMQSTADFDVRVGGRHYIRFVPAKGGDPIEVVGEFLVVDPPRRVEYSWRWKDNPEWKEPTIVRVIFNALPHDRTEIVLTHERLPDQEQREGHAEGWTNIINRMAEYFARQSGAHPA